MTDETLSLSERVIEAILCRLREVRKANGYRTDAGLRVFDSVRSVAPNDLPCFVVWEGNESAQGDTGSGSSASMTLDLTVTIEAHTKCDQDDTGKTLRAMKADAKKALLTPMGALRSSGVKVAAVAYSGAQPSPREDGDMAETVQITIVVTYPEGYGDPYAAR